ncbi:hypothetical protein QE400_003248 [Xanthomonas sacchari]|nr:hypothetical protein [Xanthomonas sacchari]
MKRLLLSSLFATAVLGGCATNRLSDDERLALYRAHAGAPVRDFQYFNQLNGWTALGDSALAVWTRPNQAYLLEFAGPLPGPGFRAQHRHHPFRQPGLGEVRRRAGARRRPRRDSPAVPHR